MKSSQASLIQHCRISMRKLGLKALLSMVVLGLSAGLARAELMIWIQPVQGGSATYSISGSQVGGDPTAIASTALATASNAYVVNVTGATVGETIDFDLYASILGTDNNAANEGFLFGALSIFSNVQSVVTATGPATLNTFLSASSNGGTNGVVTSGMVATMPNATTVATGSDIGGPSTSAATATFAGNWIRAAASATSAAYLWGNGGAGTSPSGTFAATNANGWSDILLGTFQYTLAATSGSAQIWSEHYSQTGNPPIAWNVVNDGNVWILKKSPPENGTPLSSAPNASISDNIVPVTINVSSSTTTSSPVAGASLSARRPSQPILAIRDSSWQRHGCQSARSSRWLRDRFLGAPSHDHDLGDQHQPKLPVGPRFYYFVDG